MDQRTYTITCQWDPEAKVWYVADSDVPGLATEAETLEQLEIKLKTMVPELLELNSAGYEPRRVPFELIARKLELSA